MMNISTFELALFFAEETQLKMYTSAVSEVLGEQMLEEEYEPCVVRKEKEKLAIYWRYDSCGILKEDVSNVQEVIKKFSTTIEIINGVAPIRKLSSKRLRIDWVMPVNSKYDYKNLEMKYRKAFIRENPLFKEGYDSSVVLDMKYDKLVLHHQSGAMGIAQLQSDYRQFKTKEGYPLLFLFVNSYVTDDQLEDYSKESIGIFIKDSYKLIKSHAQEFEKMMEGVL
jgi:hypothetical protein